MKYREECEDLAIELPDQGKYGTGLKPISISGIMKGSRTPTWEAITI
ncbi:MAG: hypothetical protein WBD24_07010 [Candidatus Omnitrophota bacterium]